MNDTVLQHHGVKGMKWGVRRYQNKDGTLTAAGRKRHQAFVKQHSSVSVSSIKGKNLKKAKAYVNRLVRSNQRTSLEDRISRRNPDATKKLGDRYGIVENPGRQRTPIGARNMQSTQRKRLKKSGRRSR